MKEGISVHPRDLWPRVYIRFHMGTLSDGPLLGLPYQISDHKASDAHVVYPLAWSIRIHEVATSPISGVVPLGLSITEKEAILPSTLISAGPKSLASRWRPRPRLPRAPASLGALSNSWAKLGTWRQCRRERPPRPSSRQPQSAHLSSDHIVHDVVENGLGTHVVIFFTHFNTHRPLN